MDIKEKMKNGELYVCSLDKMGVELENKLARCKELLYDYNHTRPSEEKRRTEIIQEVFAETKEGFYIEPPLNANWGCNTHIGKDFYANFNLTLVDDTDIFIGDNVMLAPNVVLATGTHPILPTLREQAYQYNLPIKIGNNVWIGAGSIVLPGVTIGDNSVIGAGSVVTKDIPQNVVAYGNPCKVVRQINEKDKEYYTKDRKISKKLIQL